MTIGTNVTNMETIMLNLKNTTSDTVTITASDVLNLASFTDTLFIKGDATDTIDIDASFTKSATSDQAGYTMYTSGGATLYS